MILRAAREKTVSWIPLFVCVLPTCLHNTIFTLPVPIQITLGLAPHAGLSSLLAQTQLLLCISYILGTCHTTSYYAMPYHILSPKLFLTQPLNILDQHHPDDKLFPSAGASTAQISSFLPTHQWYVSAIHYQSFFSLRSVSNSSLSTNIP